MGRDLAVGAAYWALGKLGSSLYYPGGVQVVWLPAGFAAAALYLGDMRWAIGAAAGDLILGTGLFPFHVHALLHDPTVVYQTVGNTIEFTLAAYLMRRRLGPGCRFERPSEVAWLLLVFAVAAPISATLGTLSSWLGHYVSASQAAAFFRTWLLADVSGAVLIVPLILVWWGIALPRRFDARRCAEAGVIVGAVLGLSIVGFTSHHPLTYVVFPALVLAAVNLGQRGATFSLLVAFAVAIVMTARNLGPFVTRSIDDEVLSTQLYMLVATLTTLTLGALVSARRIAALELGESRRRESERAAEERQRIARDLHDSVSQTLFTLGLHAGIARHEIARAALPEGNRLAAAVDEVADLAQGALLEMRASIFELRGGAVAEQGLAVVLGAHASALAVRYDVRVTITGPEERLPLTAAVEELLFRIGQEAVTNAVKHSHGKTVSVRLAAAESMVTLVIDDEGVGFDPGRAYPGHLGLDLMRDRAAEAGGSISIDSRPGTGTTVKVAVPARAGDPPVPARPARRLTLRAQASSAPGGGPVA